MISLLLAIAIGLVQPQTPGPVPAKSEMDVWRLAQTAGTPEAYLIYLKRFPEGFHSQAAMAQLPLSLGVHSALPAPPAPPAPPPPRRLITPVLDKCVQAILADENGSKPSPEVDAYLKARRNNRISDYQTVLAAFPDGACSENLAKTIRARQILKGAVKTISGFGPLAAQRTSRFTISEYDYPPAAVFNEQQGTVVAQWEVSEEGLPELCRVIQTSGSEVLDTATCRMIVARMRYDPARDATGAPVRSSDQLTLRWVLPAKKLSEPASKGD